jgi:hypothetical protein
VIQITSPSQNDIYTVAPTFTVTIASDDPSRPLDLGSFRAYGGPQDWSQRFAVGPDSATHTVTEPLVAGEFTLSVSISDVPPEGGTAQAANASRTWLVHPNLTALSPVSGEPSAQIHVAADGLDPNPANNRLVFYSFLQRDGVPAVLSSVEGTTGVVSVPHGAMSGDVFVEVNGVQSRNSLFFSVPLEVPDCGTFWQMLSLPDGSTLVAYEWYAPWAGGNDRTCPTLPEHSNYGRGRAVLRKYPDGQLKLLEYSRVDPWYGVYRNVEGIARDPQGEPAVVLTYKPTYFSPQGVTFVAYKTLPNRPTIVTNVKDATGVSFDRDGNLYLLHPQGLSMVSADMLPSETPIEAMHLIGPGVGKGLLAVGCDGFAYASDREGANTGPVWYDATIKKIDLQTHTVVAEAHYSQTRVLSLTTSCRDNSVFVLGHVGDWGEARFFELPSAPRDAPFQQFFAEVPIFTSWMNWAGLDESGRFVATSWDTYGEIYRIEPCRTSLGYSAVSCPCDGGSGAIPRGASGSFAAASADSCELPVINIVPSTTRWRPQRDTASPSGDIAVKFTSSVALQSATMSFSGPSSVPPITQNFNPENPPNPYVITWPGTSRLTNPNDPTSYLNAGDYTISITGTPAQGEPISTAANDPNAKVSLVKIEAIELTDFRGSQVTANPGPDASFAGVGRRVFAEARDPLADPAPPPPVYDTVRVAARIVPPVPLVGDQPSVTVSFQAIDADDPYVGGRIDDEGNPTDNRGDAVAGFIPVGAFNSADPLPAPLPIGAVFGVDAPREPPAGSDSMTVEVALRVSHRHGDNYRVLASLDANALGQRVRAQQRTPRTVNNVRYPAGWMERDGTPMPVNFERVEVSELLTVWRTLHLEVDRLASQDPDADQRRLDVQGDWTAVERSKLRDGEPTDPDPKPFVDDNGAADVQRLDSWVLHDGLNPWLGADLTVGFHSGDVYEVTGNGDKHVDVRIGNNQPPLTNNLSEADLAQLSDKSYILRDDPLDSLQKQADYSFAEEILRRLYIAVVPVVQPPSETEVPLVISQYSEFDQIAGDPTKRLDTRNMVHDANYALESHGWSSPDYWSVQLVSAFDGNPESDFDPTEEWDWRARRETSSGNLGVTTWGSCIVQTATGPARRGRCKPHASIFMETLTDFIRRTPRGFDPPGEGVLNRRATAHELLHALRVQHGSALMCASVMMRRDDRGECITEQHAETIRNLIQPQLSESRDRQCTQDGSDSCWRLQP